MQSLFSTALSPRRARTDGAPGGGGQATEYGGARNRIFHSPQSTMTQGATSSTTEAKDGSTIDPLSRVSAREILDLVLGSPQACESLSLEVTLPPSAAAHLLDGLVAKYLSLDPYRDEMLPAIKNLVTRGFFKEESEAASMIRGFLDRAEKIRSPGDGHLAEFVLEVMALALWTTSRDLERALNLMIALPFGFKEYSRLATHPNASRAVWHRFIADGGYEALFGVCASERAILDSGVRRAVIGASWGPYSARQKAFLSKALKVVPVEEFAADIMAVRSPDIGLVMMFLDSLSGSRKWANVKDDILVGLMSHKLASVREYAILKKTEQGPEALQGSEKPAPRRRGRAR